MSVSSGKSKQTRKSKCVGCNNQNCSECNVSDTDQLYGAMLDAIAKINKLTNKAKSLERVLGKNNVRLDKLEVHSDSESIVSHRKSRKSHRGKSSKNKTKKKFERVEFEKQRHSKSEESQSEEMSSEQFDPSAQDRKSSGKQKCSKSEAASKHSKTIYSGSE